MHITFAGIGPMIAINELTKRNVLRILLLEDNPEDAELIAFELRRANIHFSMRRVETRSAFLEALEEFAPNAIFADYSLPQFSAMEALELLEDDHRDVPFILVTGSQTEEIAAEAIKKGADDYILKQSLMRLPTALRHAMEKRESKKKREQTERRLHTTNEQLRALSARLQSVREEERIHIAREIHDELGQTLTGLRLDLAWLHGKLSSKNEIEAAILDQITAMSRLTDSAIQTIRRIATELRPRILDDLGLIPALDWQTEEFQTRTGIRCTFSSNIEEASLDSERSTAIFRILQASLTNVARHANATRVEVHFELRGGKLKLEVKDNGKGITEAEITNIKSLGLLGMKERAYLLGGVVTIAGRKGHGTTVTVELPV